MKTGQPIDRYARDLDGDRKKAVYGNVKAVAEKRRLVLARDYPDPDRLRRLAGRIKQHTLEHLDLYLERAEKQFKKNGVSVHFAMDGKSCNRIILEVMRKCGCRRLVKSKSMLSEEIGANDYLIKNGIQCVETDLGEIIVQLDKDRPSHIVAPIIHKNRREIAECFEREGLGEYNDEPKVITRRARAYLRKKYREADAALTGANFVVAESGRISLVTNEGNARFCLAATSLHIVVVGIEKLLPKDRDLTLFLNLIARSGTGQQLTVYNQFISGPRGPGQPDGPESMHVIFVDNGRTDILASDCREILRCIRCGACQNVCPVYRQASGFAYRSTYAGPVGAVLSPLLAGDRFPEVADLPKASSLCGACREVCPVDIPIPDLLLRLRARGVREGAGKAAAGTPSMGLWAILCTRPGAWKTALEMGAALNAIPRQLVPIPALRTWLRGRKLPPWRGGRFRAWMKRRESS